LALSFFDMSVSVTPPTGHREPLPITLGPNWQPNDIRLIFMSASGSGDSAETTIMMPMIPDPPATFTTAYSLNPGRETHGVYWRRLAAGDEDTAVAFAKPQGWRHFMLATVTVRGASPTASVSAGSLAVTYLIDDATTSGTVSSAPVPGAGAMLLMLGSIPSPSKSAWPKWAVSTGVPSGWSHLVATEKSGADFFQYDTSPSLMVVGKSFASSGSTGVVSFPASLGAPAFASMYAFITAAADVSVTVGAA
jgi:hypothetical protein